MDKQYNRYERDPEVTRKYGRAWKRIRDRYAKVHPLCESCLEEGRLTPVEEVHHIVPISQGGTHNENNLMSLCQSCHTKVTGRGGSNLYKAACRGTAWGLVCEFFYSNKVLPQAI